MRTMVWAVGALAVGCGGSAYQYEGGSAPATTSGGYVTAAEAPGAPAADYYDGDGGDDVAYAADEEAGGFGGDTDSWSEFEGEAEEPADMAMRQALGEARDARMETARELYARNMPQQQTTPAGGQGAGAGNQAAQQQQATDAVDTSGPLLIYTAQMTLAVYEVTETQDAILGAISEMNGFLAERSDSHLVVRVPAEKFHDAMTEVEGKGDVLHRQINVQDVSEEFRDVAIRIRNSEVMRDRLEQLLARADDVEGALAIERELQRLTDLIERLKGRQRFLADRIAFSTITINFASRATEGAPDEFRLPFDWLNELGISNLLTLR